MSGPGAMPELAKAGGLARDDEEVFRASLAFCMYSYDCLNRLHNKIARVLPTFSAFDYAKLPVYGFFPDASRFRVIWSDPALHVSSTQEIKAAGIDDGCHFCGAFEHIEKRQTYLVFVGSTTVKDWLANFSAYTAWSTSGSSHAGFASRANQVMLDGIIERLNASQHLVLCGHSLGGAVASLVTRRILHDPRLVHSADLRHRLRCVTFGAPFYCNNPDDQFADHFLHIVHAADMVVTAPQLINVLVSNLLKAVDEWAADAAFSLMTDIVTGLISDKAATSFVAAAKQMRLLLTEDPAGAKQPAAVVPTQTQIEATPGSEAFQSSVSQSAFKTLTMGGLNIIVSTFADGYKPHGRFVLVGESPSAFRYITRASPEETVLTFKFPTEISPRLIQHHMLQHYYTTMQQSGLLPTVATNTTMSASAFDNAAGHQWAVQFNLTSARTSAWLWAGADAQEVLREINSHDETSKALLLVELHGSNLDWLSAIRLKGRSETGRLLSRSQLPDCAIYALPTVVGPDNAAARGLEQQTVTLEIRTKWYTSAAWQPIQIKYDVDRSPAARRGLCAPDTVLFTTMLMLLRSYVPQSTSAQAPSSRVALDRVERQAADFDLIFSQSVEQADPAMPRKVIQSWSVRRCYKDFVELDPKIRLTLQLTQTLPPAPSRIWRDDETTLEQRRAGLHKYVDEVLAREHNIAVGTRLLDCNITVANFVGYKGAAGLALAEDHGGSGPINLQLTSAQLPTSASGTSTTEFAPAAIQNWRDATTVIAVLLSSIPQLQPSASSEEHIFAALYARFLASCVFVAAPGFHEMVLPRLFKMMGESGSLRSPIQALAQDVHRRTDLADVHTLMDTVSRLCSSLSTKCTLIEVIGDIVPAEKPGLVALLPEHDLARPEWYLRDSAVQLARGRDASDAVWDHAAKRELAEVLAARASVAYWTVTLCRDILTINPFSAGHVAWAVLAVGALFFAPFVGVVIAAAIGVTVLVASAAAIAAAFASLSVTLRQHYGERVRDLLNVVSSAVNKTASSTYDDESALLAQFDGAVTELAASPSLARQRDESTNKRRAELFERLIMKRINKKHISTEGQIVFAQQLLFIQAIHKLRNFVFDAVVVPVFGVQNAGKSTLCSLVTGRDAVFQPGARNTRVPTCFATKMNISELPGKDHVTLVDFPALTDGGGVTMGMGLEILPASAGFVLVIPFDQANTHPAQLLLRSLASHPSAPSRILVCLTKVDTFLRMVRDSFQQAIAVSTEVAQSNPMQRRNKAGPGLASTGIAGLNPSPSSTPASAASTGSSSSQITHLASSATSMLSPSGFDAGSPTGSTFSTWGATPLAGATPAVFGSPSGDKIGPHGLKSTTSSSDSGRALLTDMRDQFIKKCREARNNLYHAVSGDIRVHCVPVMFTAPEPVIDQDTILDVAEAVCEVAPDLIVDLAVGSEERNSIMFGPLALKVFLRELCVQWKSQLTH